MHHYLSSGLVAMSPSLFVKDRRIVLFFFFRLCGHLSSDGLSVFSIASRDPVNHTFVSAWGGEYSLAVLLFTRELHVYISATAPIFHLFMNNRTKYSKAANEVVGRRLTFCVFFVCFTRKENSQVNMGVDQKTVPEWGDWSTLCR